MSTEIKSVCTCHQNTAVPPPTLEEIRATSAELRATVHAVVHELNEGLCQSAAAGGKPACVTIRRELPGWVKNEVVKLYKGAYEVQTLSSTGNWRRECDTTAGLHVNERNT